MRIRVLAGLITGVLLILGAGVTTPSVAAKPSPYPDGAFVQLVKITPTGATLNFRCDAAAAAAGDSVDILVVDYITYVARQDLVPGPDGAGLLVPCASDGSVQTVTIPIEPLRTADCVSSPETGTCYDPRVAKGTTFYGVTAFLSYNHTPVDQQTRTRYNTFKVTK